MKLYLDNSFLNRPFDDPDTGMNRVESDILSFIVNNVKNGIFLLVHSSVLAYENSLNPAPVRRKFVDEVLELASEYQNYNKSVQTRAQKIEKQYGLTSYDARHIASAEVVKVDFFITCDYSLTKKYKGKLRVTTPIVFIHNYENFISP